MASSSFGYTTLSSSRTHTEPMFACARRPGSEATRSHYFAPRSRNDKAAARELHVGVHSCVSVFVHHQCITQRQAGKRSAKYSGSNTRIGTKRPTITNSEMHYFARLAFLISFPVIAHSDGVSVSRTNLIAYATLLYAFILRGNKGGVGLDKNNKTLTEYARKLSNISGSDFAITGYLLQMLASLRANNKGVHERRFNSCRWEATEGKRRARRRDEMEGRGSATRRKR